MRWKSINLIAFFFLSVSALSFSQNDDVIVASEDALDPEKKLMKVYISGEVSQPQTLLLERGSSLGDALEKANGPTTLAALHRVILLRERKKWQYDLNNEDHKKIKLHPFDLLFVPQMQIIGK